MQQLLRPAFSIILIVLSILGLMNVYGDNTEVERMAKLLACPDCESTVVELARTPLSQTLHVQTHTAGVVIVECQREAIFLGAYACTKL